MSCKLCSGALSETHIEATIEGQKVLLPRLQCGNCHTLFHPDYKFQKFSYQAPDPNKK